VSQERRNWWTSVETAINFNVSSGAKDSLPPNEELSNFEGRV
jgi:hypothetical protein